MGYRTLWQRLVVDHKLRVPRDKVLRIMQIADPDGIALRKGRRLKRRKYYAIGPNYIWHADGYDKLKPFGFCIHGAIDGLQSKNYMARSIVQQQEPFSYCKVLFGFIGRIRVGPTHSTV